MKILYGVLVAALLISALGVRLAAATTTAGETNNDTGGISEVLQKTDNTYISFLQKIENIFLKIWNWARGGVMKTSSYIFGSPSDNELGIKVVQKREESSSVQAGLNASSSTTTASQNSGQNTLSEEAIRMIAKEVFDAEFAKTIDYTSRPANRGSALYVGPAGSGADSKALLDKIQNTFSDEVSVTLNGSQSSGVVRPVFRDSTDEAYQFILVPVANKN